MSPKLYTSQFSSNDLMNFFTDKIDKAVFKIIAVFLKKVSKAKNPYNKFYFNTHKCIGNIAHSILNQNMKNILSNLLLLYRK